MSDISAITRLREQRVALIEQMRGVINTADAEGRDLTAEELGEIEQRNQEVDDFDRQIATREKTLGHLAETKLYDERSLPRPSVETSVKSVDTDEYRAAFNHYLRTGETRDQLLSPDSAGGYLVPTELQRSIVEYRTFFGVMRRVASSFQTSGGYPVDWPRLTARGAAAATAEGGAYSESNETFGEVTFNAHKMTRMVQVSEELLQDSVFDLGSLISRRLGESLAYLEQDWFIDGTGSSQPTGILAASNGLSNGKTTSGATAITFDEVIELIHSVEPPYRNQNSRFIMADSTVSYLRLIKTGVASDKRYLWQESTVAGMPAQLFGYPVEVDPFMPAIASTNKTIAFGDFSAAYMIRDAGPVVLKRLDERYAEAGLVAFLAMARVDGKVIDPNAAKVMTQTT